MLHSVDRVSPDTLKLRGTPDEIRGDQVPFVDAVAGFSVIKVTDGGQHDGHSAHVITLADDMGGREIGRIIVRDDVPYRDECLEWERIFSGPSELEEFVTEHEKATVNPVAHAVIDFAWDAYPSLEMGIAETAAEFGVSIKVLREHGPGGGWPEIEVTGLREKVRHLLKKGWDYSDEMIAEELG